MDIALTSIILIVQLVSSLAVLWMTRRYINDTINSVIDAFEENITSPMAKRAMSILGTKSGEVRGQNAMVEKIAGDVLNGPKMAAIKIGASALGLDLDSYVEEHGALQTLQGMQSVAGMLGIDINTMLSGGGQVQGSVGGKNPYI